MKNTAALVLGLCISLPWIQAQVSAPRDRGEPVGDLSPLAFEELVTLSSTEKPTGALAFHLNRLLNTPTVDNSATHEDVAPHRPAARDIGPVLRLGVWNIERGLNFGLIRSALTNTTEFEGLTGSLNRANASRRKQIESQLATLQDADVLVLNEVDLGMQRTEYRDVARELAAALHLNYAYGVEFVEVDPVFELGTEKVHLPNRQEDQRLQQDLQVDRERYKGLHGTAILSRYQILSARILRLPTCYDWYAGEAKEIARIEKGKRWAAHRLFRERIGRELRHGGRMALIADLAVPDSPTGAITVVATHLENRCTPACRRRQTASLLADIRENRNPLVVAGDLNTTGRNNTPTSLRNEIMSRVTDYQFWISQTVSYFHPLGMYQHALFPIHYLHGYNDPTAFHLPVLWNNTEQPLFAALERFHFTDGSAFDFRGEPERTLNHRGHTLSDSNERSRKGFVPTYAFARDYLGLVGRFKLDWVFVKPLAQDASKRSETRMFMPHFPQTMRELNGTAVGRMADHAPMTVDLPLTEPLSPSNHR